MTEQSAEFLAGFELAMKEAEKIVAGWGTEACGGDYMTDGNEFWDAGNIYDQARQDAGAKIRFHGENRLKELSKKGEKWLHYPRASA